MLNGSLALEALRTPMEEKLKTNGGFDDKPRLHILGDPDNEYIQVKGAALALIRWHVHRCLPSLLGGTADRTAQQIRNLTIPLAEAQVAKLSSRGRRSS